MPARTVDLDTIPYRIHVNKERNGYRAFWFCPHHDCFGAFRTERNSERADDVIEVATEAARSHEAEAHGRHVQELYADFGCEAVAGLKIHG